MAQNEIELRLGQYHDPRLGTDLKTAKAIKRVHVDFDRVEVDITVGYPTMVFPMKWPNLSLNGFLHFWVISH